MKNLLTVSKFTIKEMIKRKSFIVSNIIIIALILIGFNIPNLLKTFSDDSLFENEKIYIVDFQNVFEGALENLNEMNLNYNLVFSDEEPNKAKIKEKIDSSEIDSALIISKDENNAINIEYVVDNLIYVENIPEDIVNALSSLYTHLNISKLNISPEELASITPTFSFEMSQTDEQEVQGNVLVIMLSSIVLFYAIYFCAYQVSSSITTEKTSKIIETLVTSTSPKIIVLGKTIGIGIVGLIQVIVLIAVALFSANTFLDEGLLESLVDVTQITPFLGIMFIIYFILGYFMYALIYALTGSTVSKPEDIQSANSPVAFLAIIGFYLSYFTMMNPTSSLNKIAALVPISSPFCMPFRIMMGLATLSEVIISVVILIATILVVARVSIKIYSSAILNTGSKVVLKDLIKIYKDKNM